MPIREYFGNPRLTLDILYLHNKFEESCFKHSRDMIAGIKIENEAYDHDHAPIRGGLSFQSWDLIVYL